MQFLAQELSSGKVELPSFPDIAIKVRKVLSDEDVNLDMVVRVVGSEPTLAARLLQIANSVAMNRSGTPVNGSAQRGPAHGPEHGAQRRDCLCHGADEEGATSSRGSRRRMAALWQRCTAVAAMAQCGGAAHDQA